MKGWLSIRPEALCQDRRGDLPLVEAAWVGKLGVLKVSRPLTSPSGLLTVFLKYLLERGNAEISLADGKGQTGLAAAKEVSYVLYGSSYNQSTRLTLLCS